jgi:hypothetical protein
MTSSLSDPVLPIVIVPLDGGKRSLNAKSHPIYTTVKLRSFYDKQEKRTIQRRN